ncbi:hypothetical protein [Mycolicibacterium sp. P9-64]|uniref:hypothetical protein n=1 Tax=Mycolicibacterium sp. P9-64 TaxID=2024612 RepID=UPI001F5BDD1F|nr:hypothetical protein [Mycolicibacterium sp. P9-64]
MNILSNRRFRRIRERNCPATVRGALGTATALLAMSLLPVGAANAAPTGPSSVDQVIDQLKTAGYIVVVNRIGSRPSDECKVAAIRQGQTYSRIDHGVPGQDLATTIMSKTVYVDVRC